MLRALVLSLLFTASALAADRPPNIVFIFADDLGIDDLSCYGRKDQPTPVLDHLAGEGMRFSTAYCAQPICSASRAALLTGKSPARLHITTFLPGRPDKPSQKLLHPLINQQLALEETTLAEALKPAGYVSACIGKWHLGGVGFGPAQQGFDVVFAGHANTAPTEEEGGKGEYELTAHGLEFIEANRDKPFYLYLAHNSPHIPLAAQMKRIENHPDAFNPLYAAVIETLDDSIGRVLRKLDELHLREQTIVIFASDNGGLHVAEGGLTAPSTHNGAFRAGKGYLYEGGLREPLIVRWPGHVPPGVVNPTPVSLADLMPTLVELAGAPKREGLDFQSIAGLLQGKEGTRPTEFYWHFPHYTNQGSRPAGAVRLENWKLIENYEDGSAELYDLATDAGEQTNLAAREPARVAEMRGKLAAWRIAVNAQEMTANPAFDLAWYNEIYPVLDTTNIKTAPTGADLPGARHHEHQDRADRGGDGPAVPGVAQSDGPSRAKDAAGRRRRAGFPDPARARCGRRRVGAAVRAAAAQEHARLLEKRRGHGELDDRSAGRWKVRGGGAGRLRDRQRRRASGNRRRRRGAHLPGAGDRPLPELRAEGHRHAEAPRRPEHGEGDAENQARCGGHGFAAIDLDQAAGLRWRRKHARGEAAAGCSHGPVGRLDVYCRSGSTHPGTLRLHRLLRRKARSHAQCADGPQGRGYNRNFAHPPPCTYVA
jgi:arylsulfatase A-like enzyme